RPALLRAGGRPESGQDRLRWPGRGPAPRTAHRHLRARVRGRLLGRSAPMIRRRILGLALIAATLGLAACGDGGETAASGGTPKELNFAITPAEGQQSMQPLWQPLLDDMSRQIGVKVKPYF